MQGAILAEPTIRRMLPPIGENSCGLREPCSTQPRQPERNHGPSQLFIFCADLAPRWFYRMPARIQSISHCAAVAHHKENVMKLRAVGKEKKRVVKLLEKMPDFTGHNDPLESAFGWFERNGYDLNSGASKIVYAHVMAKLPPSKVAWYESEIKRRDKEFKQAVAKSRQQFESRQIKNDDYEEECYYCASRGCYEGHLAKCPVFNGEEEAF
jgi:hypothetical protein